MLRPLVHLVFLLNKADKIVVSQWIIWCKSPPGTGGEGLASTGRFSAELELPPFLLRKA